MRTRTVTSKSLNISQHTNQPSTKRKGHRSLGEGEAHRRRALENSSSRPEESTVKSQGFSRFRFRRFVRTPNPDLDCGTVKTVQNNKFRSVFWQGLSSPPLRCSRIYDPSQGGPWYSLCLMVAPSCTLHVLFTIDGEDDDDDYLCICTARPAVPSQTPSFTERDPRKEDWPQGKEWDRWWSFISSFFYLSQQFRPTFNLLTKTISHATEEPAAHGGEGLEANDRTPSSHYWPTVPTDIGGRGRGPKRDVNTTAPFNGRTITPTCGRSCRVRQHLIYSGKTRRRRKPDRQGRGPLSTPSFLTCRTESILTKSVYRCKILFDSLLKT